MPVSSTLSTSAPKSASRSEQNPPGRRRVRSSTRTSLRAPSLVACCSLLDIELRASSNELRSSQQLPRLLDGRHPAPRRLHHLARLRDQLAVRAGHLAVREVEVVLQPDPEVASQRQRRGPEPPLLARDPDHSPVVA